MPISGRFVVKYTGLLLAIGFLTLLGIVGMTIWLGERAQTYANDAIQARDTRVSAVELRSAVQSAESAQRGFLVSGNEIYLAPYDSAKVSLQRQLNRLKLLLTPYKKAEAMLRRLSVIIDEKINEMDRTIILKKEQHDSESLSIFRTNRGKALMDEANVFLSSVIRATDERLTRGVTEQRENAAGRFSLGTREPAEAKRLHALRSVEVEQRWSNLRRGPQKLSWEEAAQAARTIIDQWKQQLAADPHQAIFWDTSIGSRLWKDSPGELYTDISQPLDPEIRAQRDLESWCARTAEFSQRKRAVGRS